jgi:CheY-like chemotaxis protein
MSRILIVDDEESIRTLLGEVLGSNGYECDAVGTAMEALKRIEASDYSLVIMDQNMPLMTGAQAIGRLRSNPKHRGLPILMCTSRPLAEDVGANAYIVKPIDLQRLLDAVKRAVAGPAAA